MPRRFRPRTLHEWAPVASATPGSTLQVPPEQCSAASHQVSEPSTSSSYQRASATWGHTKSGVVSAMSPLGEVVPGAAGGLAGKTGLMRSRSPE